MKKQKKDKKPYQPPVLSKYGAVSTLSASGTGKEFEDGTEVNPLKKP
jgi:hypothetical protein